MFTTVAGLGGWPGLAPVPLLAFGLIPGPRELILVILVALVLYGRSGVRVLESSRRGKPVSPWVRMLRAAVSPTPAHRRKAAAARAGTAQAPPRKPGQGRLFWAFTLIAAVAVAAWIAARVVMHASTLSAR